MCGQAYLTGARIAADATGPCAGYAPNEEPFLEVIKMHRDATLGIDSQRVPAALYENAKRCWEEAYVLGRVAGFRNAQTTVIAPTGTIGFMMNFFFQAEDGIRAGTVTGVQTCALPI